MEPTFPDERDAPGTLCRAIATAILWHDPRRHSGASRSGGYVERDDVLFIVANVHVAPAASESLLVITRIGLGWISAACAEPVEVGR